ncbi:hypothetical protein PybrP1_003165, partial [[Pythium] brassicae (nom. inval.)]
VITALRVATRVFSLNDRRGAFVHSIRNLWSSQQLKADKFDPDVYKLLLASQTHRRDQREFYFAEKLSFSWIRFFSGLVSLVLAFSDVPRSGLAIIHFPTACPELEPDVFQSFGPWFYSRAFAEHFRLAAFPDCIMYRSSCSGALLNGRVVFDMLDSIVDVAVDRRAASHFIGSRESEPTRIALRSENDFLDRVHHYLAPNLFPNHIWRTNQLFYYPPEALYKTDGSARSVCTDYRKAHPTMQVDLTYLESQEDLQRVTGGLSPTAVWKSDVTTIIRARQCSGIDTTSQSRNCTTTYIDEYRYEVGIVYSDMKQWYRVVASLRGIGQLYVYLRVAMLFVFAFIVFDDSTALISERRVWGRARKMVVLICKMPMQSVIFGSPFPIFCYAGAHLIDSAISYEILSKKFNTQGGIFELNFADVLTVGFNQMRSVWLLAAVCHLWLLVSTSRTKLIWSPISGVLGVPELLFSGISSLTIVAQYRSIRFRSAGIRQVFEVSDSPRVGTVRYRQDTQYRGSGNVQLGGAWVDAKFFLCTLTVLFTVYVVWLSGVLWPVGAMIVHWTSDYFCVNQPAQNEQLTIIRRLTRMAKRSDANVAPSLPVGKWRGVAVVNILSKNRLADVMEHLPSVVMSSSAFHSIQLQMESLHDRGDDIEATIAFMNLVNMSDPLVYFGYIIGGGGVQLGYFQSRKRRERFFLLPLATDARYFSEYTRDLKLVREYCSAARVDRSIALCT